LEITTTKSVLLIAKITQKNREILEGLIYIYIETMILFYGFFD